MSSSLRRSQRKRRGYRCGDIVEVLDSQSLRTGKLIRKAVAPSVKSSTRWIVSIVASDGEEEGNGLEEVCEKSLGAVVEEGPTVTDDSSVSVAPSLGAPSSKTTANTAAANDVGRDIQEHDAHATNEADSPSSKVRSSPNTRAATRRHSSRAIATNEAGPKATAATIKPNAEDTKNEAAPKAMKKKPGRKKKVDPNKTSVLEETTTVSPSIPVISQATRGRVGRKRRGLLPSAAHVEHEGTSNKKSKASPTDGADSPTSVTEASFLPPPLPIAATKGRKRSANNAGGHRAVTRALSKTSDTPAPVDCETPMPAPPPAITSQTSNAIGSIKKATPAKPGRGGRRGGNPPGRPRKTTPKKRGVGVKAGSTGSAKKRRINANGEYVETVKMLTGTLYLYRGECRRVEFVRTA